MLPNAIVSRKATFWLDREMIDRISVVNVPFNIYIFSLFAAAECGVDHNCSKHEALNVD